MVVLCISFSVAVLDQFTKFLVRRGVGLSGEIVVVPGLLSLRYVENTGAAWGMLAGLNGWLVLLSGAILIFLVCFRRYVMDESVLHRVARGLMIAGIVGNLLDRLRLGYVVDFLDFHLRGHHFPAFNVADSAICTGVGLYILSQVLPGRRRAGHVVSGA